MIIKKRCSLDYNNSPKKIYVELSKNMSLIYQYKLCRDNSKKPVHFRLIRHVSFRKYHPYSNFGYE